MDYITLNTGDKMPLIGFGTYQINGEDCTKSVLYALEVGYRLIDTATAYNNEEYVGTALKQSSLNRKDIFVTTKLPFKAYSKAAETIEQSLQKLQLDYIDLVLLHWPFNDYYFAYRVLEEYYNKGIIKNIGVSNFNADRLVDLIGYNKIKPAVNQIETHLLCQRKECAEWMKKYNVSHQAYSPLGQFREPELFNNPSLLEIAKQHNKSTVQIALKFLVQSGISIIPKSVNAERIKANIDIFDFTLTAQQMDTLSALDRNVPLIGNPENPAKVESALSW